MLARHRAFLTAFLTAFLSTFACLARSVMLVAFAVAGLCAGMGCEDSVCAPPKVLCGGFCKDLRSDPNNCRVCGGLCNAGDSCVSGKCVPPPCGANSGLTQCSDLGCIDLTTNAANCGGCGTACATGYTCVASACTASTTGACGVGYTDCGNGACKNLGVDPYNCGLCGRVCPSGVCSASVCQ